MEFRTYLGQLVQRMHDPAAIHGIALPDLLKFRRHAAVVIPWFVELLGMHWLFVGNTGIVRIVAPAVGEHHACRARVSGSS